MGHESWSLSDIVRALPGCQVFITADKNTNILRLKFYEQSLVALVRMAYEQSLVACLARDRPIRVLPQFLSLQRTRT